MELVDFLRARFEDDARIARAASPGPWRTGVRSGTFVVEGDGWTVGSVSDLDGEHIARHDPARVLGGVEALRALLAFVELPEGSYHEWQLLVPFARVWRDHPDFDPAWLED